MLKIRASPSKSQSIRALLFASLACGESQLSNLLDSPDIHAAIDIFQAFGASIEKASLQKDSASLAPLRLIACGNKPRHPGKVLDVGNSGLLLRFAPILAALCEEEVSFTGDASIQNQRPINELLKGLEAFGCHSSSRGGFAPFSIRGPHKLHSPSSIELQGQDSQPISALLLCAALASSPTDLHVSEPGEKPWIQLTLDWFSRLGIPYTRRDFSFYQLQGQASWQGFIYRVPGDYSSASYPLVLAFLQGKELCIEDLPPEESQGERALIPLLQKMGAKIHWEGNNLILKKSPRARGGSFDINACIDSLPLLAFLGTQSQKPLHIYNARVARSKESDRLTCISSQLRKMGARIEEKEDSLTIFPSKLLAAKLSSFHDHRIAMSLHIASLFAEGSSEIDNYQCIKKSYPRFFHDIALLERSS